MAARPSEPSSRITSTSTVGLPRESRISRAPMNSMLAMGAAFPIYGHCSSMGTARDRRSQCEVAAPNRRACRHLGTENRLWPQPIGGSGLRGLCGRCPERVEYAVLSLSKELRRRSWALLLLAKAARVDPVHSDNASPGDGYSHNAWI